MTIHQILVLRAVVGRLLGELGPREVSVLIKSIVNCEGVVELGSGGIEEVHIGGLFIEERSEEQLRLVESIDVTN